MGGQLQCASQVTALEWWVQGLTFTSDARVPALRCYDMIIGEDWLESVSPVWVDFKSKAMRITHKGKRIALQGVQDNTAGCLPIPAKKLQGLIRGGGVAYCIKMLHDPPHAVLSDDQQYICSIQTEDMPAVPTEVQELIQQYEPLFATHTELPPARLADDQINLMPGAQPVRVRPYHYSPIQKTEIETQVKEMLNNGVVRPSASAFASPVLLVCKKDGT